MAKEEFLTLNKKAAEAKHVTVELILSKENSNYAKF